MNVLSWIARRKGTNETAAMIMLAFLYSGSLRSVEISAIRPHFESIEAWVRGMQAMDSRLRPLATTSNAGYVGVFAIDGVEDSVFVADYPQNWDGSADNNSSRIIMSPCEVRVADARSSRKAATSVPTPSLPPMTVASEGAGKGFTGVYEWVAGYTVAVPPTAMKFEVRFPKYNCSLVCARPSSELPMLNKQTKLPTAVVAGSAVAVFAALFGFWIGRSQSEKRYRGEKLD